MDSALGQINRSSRKFADCASFGVQPSSCYAWTPTTLKTTLRRWAIKKSALIDQYARPYIQKRFFVTHACHHNRQCMQCRPIRSAWLPLLLLLCASLCVCSPIDHHYHDFNILLLKMIKKSTINLSKGDFFFSIALTSMNFILRNLSINCRDRC